MTRKIRGPKKDFFEEELETFLEFVQKGGKVLFMMDPFYTLPKFSAFLSNFDVVLGNNVIIDRYNRSFGGDDFVILVPFFRKNPITQDFEAPALFPLARSIEVKRTPKKGIFAKTFAMSTPESWAVSDKKDFTGGEIRFQEGVDKKGPVLIAAIVILAVKQRRRVIEEERAEGQMVIYGDSDFINNFYIDYLGNKDLFLNTVNWMSGDEYQIFIHLGSKGLNTLIDS